MFFSADALDIFERCLISTISFEEKIDFSSTFANDILKNIQDLPSSFSQDAISGIIAIALSDQNKYSDIVSIKKGIEQFSMYNKLFKESSEILKLCST